MLLNLRFVGQQLRCSHHLPQSARARGGWPWRWEGRSPAWRRPWRRRTCWWWSVSGWPCSEDCFGGLGEAEEEREKQRSRVRQRPLHAFVRGCVLFILAEQRESNPQSWNIHWNDLLIRDPRSIMTLPIRTSAEQPFTHFPMKYTV